MIPVYRSRKNHGSARYVSDKLNAGPDFMQKIISTIALSCCFASTFTFAQDIPAAEKNSVVAQIQSRYYNLTRQGFHSGSCDVNIDYKNMFQAMYKDPTPEQTKQFNDGLAVMDRVKTTVTFNDQNEIHVANVNPEDFKGAGFASWEQIESGMNTSVRGVWAGWLGFALKPPFANLENGSLEPRSGGGYVASLKKPAVGSLTFDASLALTDLKFETDQMSISNQLTWADSTSGYLLKTLSGDLNLKPMQMPHTSYSYTYQTVGGFQLPSHVAVDLDFKAMPHLEMSFTNCKVNQ
jgi:hypothetical protein